MTWIIIIILVLVVIFMISNQKHNKAVEQHHINQGGFRKSYPTFTNHLENFYEMTLVNDTGRSFSYSKDMTDTNGNRGKLIVGIKLDVGDNPMIYSKFQSKYKGEFPGINVLDVDYKNIDSIDRCINISIDKIKKQGIIEYQDKLSGLINHAVPKQFIDEWNIINKESADTEISSELNIFVNDFYIPDLISTQKFIKNFSILNSTWNGINLKDLIQGKETQGTASMKDISHIPPIFSFFFIAAYPDVYQWFQKNAQTGKIHVFNKLDKLSDDESEEFFQNPQKINEMYRSLINQFKEEGNELETKK